MNEAINPNSAGHYETAIGQKNRGYYIHKFLEFDQKEPGSKVSWNWAAFFFGGIWALYRKMYGWFFAWWFVAILVSVFSSVPAAEIQLILAVISLAVWLGFAVFANSFYHSKINARIAAANKSNSDASLVNGCLQVKGGVHSWVPIVFGVFPAIGIAAAVAIPAFLGKTKEQVALIQPVATSSTPTAVVPDAKLQASSQPKPDQVDLASIKNLAEQGDAGAQVAVGYRYWTGDGVPKNAGKGMQLVQMAAAQGLVRAQVVLGGMYWWGDEPWRDTVLAYAWMNVAAASGDKYAASQRDFYEKDLFVNRQERAERSMSSAEILEAQRISSDWKTGRIIFREVTSGATNLVAPRQP